MYNPNAPDEPRETGRRSVLGEMLLDFLAEFGRELAGLCIALFGLLVLAGLFTPANSLLTRLYDATRLFLGAAAIPAALLLAGVGIILIANRYSERLSLAWQQIFGFEVILFSLAGILHALSPAESPQAAARAGQGGGHIGWLVSMPFINLLGTAGAVVALALVMSAGFLLAARATRRDLRLLGAFLLTQLGILWVRVQPERRPPEAPPAQPAPRPTPTKKPAAERRQPAPPPPAETPRPKSEKPAAPPKRKERAAPPPVAPPRAAGLPPLDLLRPDSAPAREDADTELKGDVILDTLAAFGVPAQIVAIQRGPTVTQFGVEPGYVKRRDENGQEVLRKVSVNRIQTLSNDLALALAATAIRIEAPVPGRPYVGIEVPNSQTQMVSLRGVMESEAFRKIKSPLAFALGRDVSGAPAAADLASMPHLLIAGATGSGKSVCINAIVTGLLCQNQPDTLRLLLIDPKRVELTSYNGAPHLIAPVIVDMEQVVGALHWVVREMTSRYEQFAGAGARHLVDYNQKALRHGETPLPYLVVIVDELADLMMLAPDDVEHSICRIAQMARATGIHLIIATQRPSVDVVTGLIKANFPARISFAVTSQIDSRVILDSAGAEKLLGRGDMLFVAPDASKLARLQGCFVSDKEIRAVVAFWQKATQAAAPADDAPQPIPAPAYPWEGDEELAEDAGDALFEKAVALLQGKDAISTSYIQRALRIGYPRAARLMDMLEERGYVGPNQGGGKSRDVLMPFEDE